MDGVAASAAGSGRRIGAVVMTWRSSITGSGVGATTGRAEAAGTTDAREIFGTSTTAGTAAGSTGRERRFEARDGVAALGTTMSGVAVGSGASARGAVASPEVETPALALLRVRRVVCGAPSVRVVRSLEIVVSREVVCSIEVVSASPAGAAAGVVLSVRPHTTAGRWGAASVDRRRASAREPEVSAGACSGTAEGRRERRVSAGSVKGASEDNRQAGFQIVSRGEATVGQMGIFRTSAVRAAKVTNG